MKNIIITILAVAISGLILSGCNNPKAETTTSTKYSEEDPVVKDAGKTIEFPVNSNKIKLFQTQVIDDSKFNLTFSAPANVIGKAHNSGRESSSSLLIFDSSELTSIYSTYLQNLTMLKTAKINFARINDLYKNGASTGKEFNDASTELANIQTTLAENEAKLRESGLNPENLNNARPGTTWLICDLPESEMNMVKKGQKYILEFPSYPEENFTANIDVIADVMNTQTRKVRLRLSLIDNKDKIRPGMFAKVKFEMPHEGLMVQKFSVISSNAKYYVFIKTSERTFQLREIGISTETSDYIEIASGVNKGEKIVVSNVYLLKGIAMGI